MSNLTTRIQTAVKVLLSKQPADADVRMCRQCQQPRSVPNIGQIDAWHCSKCRTINILERSVEEIHQ